MNKKISLLLLLSTILFFIGCSNNNNNNTVNTSVDLEIKNTTISNYTGEEIWEENIDNNPFMVIVENSVNSRPQSGLSFADIIYETLAEGGIPRFLAIFHSEQPDIIGPVRSVRQYFLDLATENNLPFAHCGGSEEALTTISQDKSLMSINEISNGKYFWRNDKRKAPHNLYTSSKNILTSISDKNFNYTSLPIAKFDKNYFEKETLTPVSNIYIELNKAYNTFYTYSDNVYIKSMDGDLAIDACNNLPLSFSNIIIQKTDITLQEDNSHLSINLLGEGEGYVFSNGRYVNALWKKDSTTDKTTFYDYNGNVIPLSPGKTIWHIVDNNTEITFN